MNDSDAALEDFTERFPHLVLVMSGPWREPDGELCEQPWIADFKNSTFSYQEVNSVSRGETMAAALQSGIEWLLDNSHLPRVQDMRAPAESRGLQR